MAQRYSLKNLAGIEHAREDVFNGLLAGQIAEQRAVAAEKMLRGQQELKIVQPMKFLAMILGNRKFDAVAAELAQRISRAVNDPLALPPPVPDEPREGDRTDAAA